MRVGGRDGRKRMGWWKGGERWENRRVEEKKRIFKVIGLN